MKKIYILIFSLICFLLSGCSDDSAVPVETTSVELSPYWEMHVGNDSVVTHHYAFELAVTNGQITGTAELIDTNNRHNGTVTGSIINNAITATVDFGADAYDFRFEGTKSDDIISGKLIFTNSLDAGTDTLDVNLVNTFNHALNFGEPAPPNPYLFNPVYITSSPTGPPVIFVHGMGGSIAEWGSILSTLSEGFKSRHNIYTYQYNWQDSLMINGRVLRDSVKANGLIDPILIAHSMGGLVSRAYVANGGQITKLVTLGTPHLGTALADILYLKPDLNTPGPKDMKPHGQFITGMQTNALDVANRSKYYCIAGRMGGYFETTYPYKWVWNETYYKDVLNGIVCTGWQLLSAYGKNDGLVNEYSALFEGGGVNLPLSTQLYVDHMHLVYPLLDPDVMSYIEGL